MTTPKKKERRNEEKQRATFILSCLFPCVLSYKYFLCLPYSLLCMWFRSVEDARTSSKQGTLLEGRGERGAAAQDMGEDETDKQGEARRVIDITALLAGEARQHKRML